MKHKLTLLLVSAALVAALFTHADGPQDDIRNGWYPQLPPISSADLNAVIACLVGNGAPANPEVYVEKISNFAGGPGVAPTQLIWRVTGPRATEVREHGLAQEIRTDAVLTYHSPAIAYLDIARAFGLEQRWVNCSQQTATVIVQVKNPVGDPWPEKCPTCARSASGDVFERGATFTDSRGKWIKQTGHSMMFGWPYGYWERQ